jgi:hypothetical protein
MTDENRDQQGGLQGDSDARTARVVNALLVLSPFLFVFCYFLSLAQGASQGASLAIGLAGFMMCLGAAALNWLRGPQQATSDLWLLNLILKLFGQ